jgi:hypothetical protein
MAEDSRWWDKYYVRYFVGTVYAVPLLIALEKTSPTGSAIVKFAEDKWVNAAAVTTAGLAFCYLSSAPILLLHSLRVRAPKTSAAFYVIAAVAAVLGLTFLIAVVRSCIPECQRDAERVSGDYPICGYCDTRSIWTGDVQHRLDQAVCVG